MSLRAGFGVLAILLLASLPAFGAGPSWQGTPLRDYIASLQEQGLRVIYSTGLVREHYRVRSDPASADPEEALREVLAPFGLTLAEGPGGSLLVTRGEKPPAAEPKPAIDSDRSVQRNDSGPQALSEIVVTSSRYDIRYQRAGSYTYLDRDITTKLPHLGDEVLRSIARLPGATGGGVSSRSHVRGGLQNEQLFLLDGLRLYEPYHMKDFHSIETIVDQGAIAGIDFYSAGYQAHYGDRMSGVVDIGLREPPEDTETQLALTFFHTSALSRGRFRGDDRGDWLFSGRRSNLDLLADMVNPDYGAPRYQDYLAHVGWEIGDHTYLSGNALLSKDKISLSLADGSEQANARYGNDVLWLKAETEWSDRLESSTILSATEIENRRVGVTDKPGVIAGSVDDAREFRSLALKQDWHYALSDRWLLRAGFEFKRLEAEYDYEATLEIAPPFDGLLDNRAFVTRDIDVAPRGSQYAGYSEVRWRPFDRLTLDLGLRWDQQTYTTAHGDEQVSPRINLLWRAGSDTDLRLAFGQYYQAQEINELQVSDGLVDFFPAQRARHLVASVTHRFDGGPELRVEAYQKKYYGLMPRFENVFNPLVLIPELQIDRARIDADSAVAEGLEITLSDGGEASSWWMSYAWSRSVDRIGGETVRRSWDQAHSLSAGISRDWHGWSFSAAGVVHTGWPRTALQADTISNADGTTGLVLQVEPRNSGRYGSFLSLDARVSRRFDLPKGELTAFLEVTNLSDHANPCCVEYSMAVDASGNPLLLGDGGTWLPIVPSLGVIWRF